MLTTYERGIPRSSGRTSSWTNRMVLGPGDVAPKDPPVAGGGRKEPGCAIPHALASSCGPQLAFAEPAAADWRLVRLPSL